MFYHYLQSPVKNLPGVGEKMSEALHRLGCDNILQLLTHFPTRVDFRSECQDLSKAESNTEYIVKLKFLEIEVNRGRKVKKISCDQDGNYVEIVYFNFFPHYLYSSKKYGDEIVVLGMIKRSAKRFQIAHPQIYKNISEVPKISVVYPLTYAINSLVIHKLTNLALLQLHSLLDSEWLDEDLLLRHGWVGFIKSLDFIHNPNNVSDLSLDSKYRRRLAFDELLASSLAISIARQNRSRGCGKSCHVNQKNKQMILDKLGFALTDGQITVLKEIEDDQISNNRMMRLLQGDVGSGKTLVALCAMLNAIGSGYQAVLMAPTDILANQHYQWVLDTLQDLEFKVELLTGKITGKVRKKILENLYCGRTKILIGTHAIFQENVEFQNLQLVVIDEQQRFGVQQRMSLMNKGKDTDVLVMSATPIPRTLSLTMYGDMDISILSGKPKGRMPINTYALQESKISTIIEMIKKKITNSERVYWICPLIEGGEDSESKAVETRFAYLQKIFCNEVGILHGKLPQEIKEAVMNQFISGEISILVSTTVIEVGVNVPEATLLIVESPDRFGLAQLHQLRGRVGRGSKQSECILLYSPDVLTHNAVEKIKIMKASNDGFYIAEQDLKLRGAGSVLGDKQSGLPGFRVADLEHHGDLLLEASKYAQTMLARQHEVDVKDKIELLLNIFGYKKNFELLDAG
jgi:ATP-dependent DNA helicase RecG